MNIAVNKQFKLLPLFASVNSRPDEGFYYQWFQWRGDAPSRLHVIRKSDGQLLTTINITALFVTHQVSLRCTAGSQMFYLPSLNNYDVILCAH